MTFPEGEVQRIEQPRSLLFITFLFSFNMQPRLGVKHLKDRLAERAARQRLQTGRYIVYESSAIYSKIGKTGYDGLVYLMPFFFSLPLSLSGDHIMTVTGELD